MEKLVDVTESLVLQEGDLSCNYERHNGLFKSCTVDVVRSGSISLTEQQFNQLALWCDDVSKEVKV